MEKKHIAVALDGPSAAGKSSVAKAVAKKYNFIYVDTGAIYRTVALAVRNAGIDPKDAAAVEALLPSLDIDITYDPWGTQSMLLDGENVADAIRTPEISLYASDVSTLPAVRAFLLDMQREMAEKHDVVMDGRDIGTVVLPQAEVKIFMIASAAVRAKRRCLELEEKGISTPYEEVLRDIEYRDAQDAGREIAPLRPAEDAVIIDTSELDFVGSVAAVCQEIFVKTGR